MSMIKQDPRNRFPYVTPAQLNRRFISPYDRTLEEGGTAPPSRSTLKKSYSNNPDKKVWKGPVMKLFETPDFENIEPKKKIEIKKKYVEIRDKILEYLSEDSITKTGLKISELEKKLSIDLPIPDALILDEISSDPNLLNYLEKELPEQVVNAIREFSENTHKYYTKICWNREVKGLNSPKFFF